MKVILCGSKGKVGQEVYNELIENDIEVIAEINVDTRTLKDVLKDINNVDYIIDFTYKDIAYQHILLAIKYHIPFICGTTGWKKEEIEYIKKLCHDANLQGIICPNFSIPINVLFNNIEVLAKDFEKVYYLESHHISKKDIPSGTAKIFKEKYPLINIKSYKKDDYVITYHLTFMSKYATMNIDYKVESKKVYAKGLIYYLKNHHLFYNLLN